MSRAKAYLTQAYSAQRRILALAAKRDRILEIAATAAGSAPDSVRVQTSGGTSRVESAAVQLADLAAEMDREIGVYTEVVRSAQALIAKLPQPRFRSVLELRYIAGLPWHRIAAIIGYSEPHSAMRVHGWALRELDALMDDKKEALP